MKKQKKLILILLGCLAVLGIALGIAYAVAGNGDTPIEEEKDPVKTFDEEVIENGRLLIYEHITRTSISHITVSNQYGTYTLRQNFDADTPYFSIDGTSPVVAVDDTTLSALISVSGYPLASYYTDPETGDERHVVNVNPDEFYRYGLADGEEQAYYELVKTDGTSYKVYVGDELPSDGGYYVRLEGRDAVYIRSTSEVTDVATVGLENTVLCPSAYYVVPYITVNAGYNNSYLYIKNFSVSERNEEGELDLKVGISYINEWDRDVFNASEVYGFIQPSSMTHYTPYTSTFNYVGSLLQEWQGDMTLEVGLLDENDELDIEKLRPYGLDDPKYMITFDMPWMTEDGDPAAAEYYPFIILVSEMTENGNYYVASLFTDVVVMLSAEELDFLLWDNFDWIDTYIMPYNIFTVSRIELSCDYASYDFRLRKSGSDVVVYEAISGTDITDISNFKNLYVQLVALDYEGDANLTDEEISDLTSDNANSLTEIKLTLTDGRTLTYRFFPYSTQRSLVVLNDSAEFYTLTSVIKKIMRSADELMRGIPIDKNTRY